MKKSISLLLMLLFFLEIASPLSQVAQVYALPQEDAQPVNAEAVTAARGSNVENLIDTNDYLSQADYRKLGLETDVVPDCFSKDDPSNPYMGFEAQKVDEIYLGYVNKTGSHVGRFSIKETAANEKALKTRLDSWPKLFTQSDEPLDLTGDADVSLDVTKETNLGRLGDTTMLCSENADLCEYQAQNTIGFIAKQRTPVTSILENQSDEAKQEYLNKLAISKGYVVENKGQISRLNSDDLYLHDQPEIIFETALFYGEYNGGLDEQNIESRRDKDPSSKIRLSAYSYHKDSKTYKPYSEPIVIKLGHDRNSYKEEYLKHLEYQNSMALTALTKGDYDKDGKEEVAVYVPDAGSTWGPYIAFYDVVNDQLQEKHWTFNGKDSGVQRIKLESIDPKFNLAVDPVKNEKWDRENLPSVHLHTTQINHKDQLVITASMPRIDSKPYKDKDQSSIMAVFDYQPAESNTITSPIMRVGKPEKLISNNVRMQFAAAADGDIDGDGQKELVVAGYMNTDYKESSNLGKIHKTNLYTRTYQSNLPAVETSIEKNDGIIRHAGINLTTNKNGDNSAFHEIEAINVDKRKFMPPVALDIGVMDPDPVSGKRAFLFANGGLYRHNPDSTKEENAWTNYSLERLSLMDHSQYSSQTGELTFHSAYFATLNEHSTMQYLMITHSNNTAYSKTFEIAADRKDVHLSILGYDQGKLNYLVKEANYLKNKNEDGGGTFLTFRPVNVDVDTVYYKYEGKEGGWSKPNVLAILPGSPGWKEFNYDTDVDIMPQVSITVSKGNTDETKANVSIGASVSGNATVVAYSSSADYLHSLATSKSDTLDITYSGYGMKDGAIIFATPKTVYKYTRFSPRIQVTEEFLNQHNLTDGATYKSGDVIKSFVSQETVEVNDLPAVNTITVDSFNKAAEAINQEHGKDEIQLIDIAEITKQTNGRSIKWGEPYSYPSRIEDFVHLKKPQKKSEPLNMYEFNGKGLSQIIDTEKAMDHKLSQSRATSSSNGFSLSFGMGFTYGVRNKVQTLITASGGVTWTSTTTDGDAFNYYVPRFADQGSANKGVRLDDYTFKVTPAMFRTDAYRNNELDAETKKAMTEADVDPEIAAHPYVLTHLISPINANQSNEEHLKPPALPENLRLYNRKYHWIEEDDGSAREELYATLTWDIPKDQDRQPTYYELLTTRTANVQSNADSQEEWFLYIGADGKPLKIPANQNFVTVYLEEYNVTKKFKLRSVYETDTEKITSVATETYTIDGLSAKYDPRFTMQPTHFWESTHDQSKVEENKIKIFNTAYEVQHPDNVVIQWQKMVANPTGKASWQDLTDSEGTVESTTEDKKVTTSLLMTEAQMPKELTHYRLRVNSGNGYINYSNVCNFYPETIENASLAVNIENPDGSPISATEITGTSVYRVSGANDYQAKIKVQAADDKGELQKDGHVILSINGVQQEVKSLSENDQQLVVFDLELKPDEERTISLMYQGTGSEAKVGHAPQFCLSSKNVMTSNDILLAYDGANAQNMTALKRFSLLDGLRDLPQMSLPGFTFTGWRLKNSLTGTLLQQISKETIDEQLGELSEENLTNQEGRQPVELEPVFEAHPYTVTYHNVENQADLQTDLLGKESLKLPRIQRPGYEFGGWYLDEALTQQVNSQLMEPMADLDLYAKWLEKTFTLHFHDENGETIRESLTYTGADIYNGGVALNTIDQTYYTDNSLSEMVDTLTPAFYGNLTVYAKSAESEPVEPETTHTVTVKVSGAGKATPDGTTEVKAGEDLTITFAPDNGYQLAKVLVNDTEVNNTDLNYQLTDIQQDYTVEVFFEAVKTADSSENDKNNEKEQDYDNGGTSGKTSNNSPTDTGKKLPLTGEAIAVSFIVAGLMILIVVYKYRQQKHSK